MIVEIQAFRDNENKYIVKELALVSSYLHNRNLYLFKPPYNIEQLNETAMKQTVWCTDHYHGLPWNYGDVDYRELPFILRSHANQHKVICTKGSEKAKWLQEILKRDVIDLDPIVQTSFKRLPRTSYYCPLYHMECAMDHCLKLLPIILKNKFLILNINKDE